MLTFKNLLKSAIVVKSKIPAIFFLQKLLYNWYLISMLSSCANVLLSFFRILNDYSAEERLSTAVAVLHITEIPDSPRFHKNLQPEFRWSRMCATL